MPRWRDDRSRQPATGNGPLRNRRPYLLESCPGREGYRSGHCIDREPIAMAPGPRARRVVPGPSVAGLCLERTRRKGTLLKFGGLRTDIEHQPVDIWFNRCACVVHQERESPGAGRNAGPVDRRTQPGTGARVTLRDHALVAESRAGDGNRVRNVGPDGARPADEPAAGQHGARRSTQDPRRGPGQGVNHGARCYAGPAGATALPGIGTGRDRRPGCFLKET
jgi:hypothetical protein